MPTIVNDLILEPKGEPPAQSAGKPSAGDAKAAASSPEMERKVEHVQNVRHQRAFRNWTY
jgi:hypothetical protein